MRIRSPLREQWAVATSLAAPSTKLSFFKDLLRGFRSVRRPLMALSTEQNMGPVRHALAQRVVAGTMEVHYSLAPREEAIPPQG
jgi:hypothetical protein